MQRIASANDHKVIQYANTTCPGRGEGKGERRGISIAVINKCCGHARDFQLRCGCGRLKRTTGSVKSPLSRPRNRDKASAGTNVRHIPRRIEK